MSEVIKEALIIDSNGAQVRCVVIENLPKKLIYRKAKKLMPKEEYSDQLVPAFTLDEVTGKKTATGELVDELLSGIERDGAGSGAFIFSQHSDEAVQRLKALVEHVDNTIADPALRIKWIPYAQQRGILTSPPVAYSSILRVHLPEPVSPSATLPVAGQGVVHPTLEVAKKPRRAITPEHRAKLVEAAKKARESKLAKAALTANVEGV